MKRPQRLESAKSWLETYKGKKVVKAYHKRYGVNFETAFTELAPRFWKINLQFAVEHPAI